MAEKKYEITYAAITDKGERTNNEDYLGVGKDNTGVLMCTVRWTWRTRKR